MCSNLFCSPPRPFRSDQNTKLTYGLNIAGTPLLLVHEHIKLIVKYSSNCIKNTFILFGILLKYLRYIFDYLDNTQNCFYSNTPNKFINFSLLYFTRDLIITKKKKKYSICSWVFFYYYGNRILLIIEFQIIYIISN